MSDQRPTTRRDLMKPAQLLGLALIAALFAGVVTLVSMGFFQNRFPGESLHAVIMAAVVAGIAFIVTIVVISLLLLAVQPSQITHTIDKPVLIARDEAVEAEAAAKEAAGSHAAGSAAAAGRDAAGSADATGSADAAEDADSGDGESRGQDSGPTAS